jgi:hypothetical protein
MVLLVNALALLWMLSVRVVPAEGGRGAGDTAVGNGDVNCDGRIDLSDPVYMLSYLFQNGPEPCAIAQEPAECCLELLARIEALENPCEVRDDRFVDNRDGTISDSCTGLMWAASVISDVDHAGARLAAIDSGIGGFTNWRLPTVYEFERFVRPRAAKWNFGSSNFPIGDYVTLWSSTAAPELESHRVPHFWVLALQRGIVGFDPNDIDTNSALFVRDPE